jgi:mono/diheme cytochrome c family protein
MIVKGVVIGFVLALIFLPLVFVGYVRSGYAPVATAAPPFPFEERLASWARHAVINREMPKTIPIQATEKNLGAGADVYRENCAVCHGLPGQPETSIAKGMFPDAPQLFMAKEMVTHDPVGETYWKATNGIRLSGMPGFKGSLSDEQLWQVSLLLQQANRLPPNVEQQLQQPMALK